MQHCERSKRRHAAVATAGLRASISTSRDPFLQPQQVRRGRERGSARHASCSLRSTGLLSVAFSRRRSSPVGRLPVRASRQDCRGSEAAIGDRLGHRAVRRAGCSSEELAGGGGDVRERRVRRSAADEVQFRREGMI